MSTPRSRRHGISAGGLTALFAAALVSGLVGCRGGGHASSNLRCESLGDDPVYLDTDFSTVVFARETDGQTSFILSDVPEDELAAGTATRGQIMHIELLWEPLGGSTPLDAAATNLSIRYVILIDDEMGLYGGAGFARPMNDPDDGRWSISVDDTSLRLLESTDGFHDPFGPARVVGRFTAEADPTRTRRLHRGLSQVVTNRLERTRLVGIVR